MFVHRRAPARFGRATGILRFTDGPSSPFAQEPVRQVLGQGAAIGLEIPSRHRAGIRGYRHRFRGRASRVRPTSTPGARHRRLPPWTVGSAHHLSRRARSRPGLRRPSRGRRRRRGGRNSGIGSGKVSRNPSAALPEVARAEDGLDGGGGECQVAQRVTETVATASAAVGNRSGRPVSRATRSSIPGLWATTSRGEAAAPSRRTRRRISSGLDP